MQPHGSASLKREYISEPSGYSHKGLGECRSERQRPVWGFRLGILCGPGTAEKGGHAQELPRSHNHGSSRKAAVVRVGHLLRGKGDLVVKGGIEDLRENDHILFGGLLAGDDIPTGV